MEPVEPNSTARPAITMTTPPQPPSDLGPDPEAPLEETDPRFPSGPWTGFFLMDHLPGRHQMELHLSFRQGTMTGEGRDRVGPFLIRGRYSVDDGKCHWTKRYIGQLPLSAQDKAKIFEGNARRVYGRLSRTMEKQAATAV